MAQGAKELSQQICGVLLPLLPDNKTYLVGSLMDACIIEYQAVLKGQEATIKELREKVERLWAKLDNVADDYGDL